ncbi:unnamed protein product, partial [Rangifer tarandus platyrhynchus]
QPSSYIRDCILFDAPMQVPSLADLVRLTCASHWPQISEERHLSSVLKSNTNSPEPRKTFPSSPT